MRKADQKQHGGKNKRLPVNQHHPNLALALQGIGKLATPKHILDIAIEFDFNYQEVRRNLKGQVSEEQFAHRLLTLLSRKVFDDFRGKIDRQLNTINRISGMVDKMEGYLKLMQEKKVLNYE